jgi:hypothetical protein
MSVIRPEDFIRFFEKNSDVHLVDIRTGRLALEVFQEEKSDDDRGLETQDEATQHEHKMGEF